MMKNLARAALTIAVTATAGTAVAQDAANGEKIYRRCQACHVVDKEQNRVGPYLKGVIGREVAAVDSYSYSQAMKDWAADKDVWTEELLFSYLEQPMQTVKGTKMAFPGLKSEEDRRDLIAFLKQHSE